MWMLRRPARAGTFALVQGCDECGDPGDKMGNLELRAGKEIVKRGLEVGRVWELAPVD